MRTRIANRARRAFTLIEILIVVVILGILAAIVIPQFSEASDDANASAVRSTLQTVRAQVQLYNFKEGDFPDSIATMVSENYLQQDPATNAPAGYTYAYAPATGAYTVTEQPTW